MKLMQWNRSSATATRLRRALLVGAVLGGISAPAQSLITIRLPDLVLQPNMAGQVFAFDPITVDAQGAVLPLTGVQLELLVADGGSEVGGSILGPAISGVTLTAPGLIFDLNNQGDLGAGSLARQVYQRMTVTAPGSSIAVNALGSPFAIVTFDTTGGVLPGVYTWSAFSSPNGSSFFTDTSSSAILLPVFENGTLTVVPEPGAAALAAGILLLGFGLWRGRGLGRSRGLPQRAESRIWRLVEGAQSEAGARGGSRDCP
jgi:hypothetical protein